MGSRALTATALMVALLLAAMTPALARPGAATSPASSTPAAAPGRLVPLREPGSFPAAPQPRTNADVVGGRTVRKGTHGFVAFIVLFDEDGEVLGDCTGTLIRWRWVLTAAHCLQGASGAAVAVRTTDLNHVRPRNVYAADAAAIAPNYMPARSRNDVGLLRLAKPAKVRPIILAGPHDDTRLRAGTKAKILGWGVDDSGTPSDRLRAGRVRLWGNGACRALFGTLWRAGRMLCGGSVTTDVCYGDSGGPLLVRRGTRWIQHGVTSFGDSECLTDDASVYTRVSAQRRWIAKVTGLRHRR